MDKKKIVDEIINDINEELSNSSSSIYACKEGETIVTDVGYVGDWFDKYEGILRKRYC